MVHLLLELVQDAEKQCYKIVKVIGFEVIYAAIYKAIVYWQ